MKHFYNITLTMVLALVNLSAKAYDFEVEGIYYNALTIRDNLTCEVTKGDNPYVDEVVIPSSVTYNGKTFSVTKIGEAAFKYDYVTSVVIPNTITSIGYDAFYKCRILESVVIGNSVTEIGGYAFCDCSSLASVEIPNSVTEIGECAFYYCEALKSVEIPNSVSVIGVGAFASCSSMEFVVIGSSVSNIGEFAFKDDSSLKEITSLAITPPTVNSGAFEGVSKMEAVVNVPTESVKAYEAANEWKEFWNIVGISESSIEGINAECGSVIKAYNLNGQEIGSNKKGIIIQNGKKIIK